MSSTPVRRRQGGPPLPIPAIAYAALMIASTVVAGAAPRPTTAAGQVLAYDRAHTTVLGVVAFLAFSAAVPLAIWTATTYRRMRTLGVTAPGAVIGLVGGVLAATSLAVSALVTWTLGQVAGVAGPALAKTFTVLAFATGAAGFVVPFSLAIAGVAVPSLFLRFLPRPVVWTGLAIAAIGMASTFTLLVPALDPTLPVGRFGGALWIVAASLMLPVRRSPAGAARTTESPDRPAASPSGKDSVPVTS